MSPYSELDNGPSGEFVISGAGLLVWAMAGADLLGVPEFRPYREGNEFWALDTDATFDNGAGAYALKTQTLEPARARVAPFVDISKVDVTHWNPAAQTTEGTGSFEISTGSQSPARTRGGRPGTAQLSDVPGQLRRTDSLLASGQGRCTSGRSLAEQHQRTRRTGLLSLPGQRLVGI